MKHVYILLTLVIAFVLGACGGTTAVDQPVASEIDLASLPTEVDVATVAAVQNQPDVLVLDVREQWEYAEGHIPGVTHIPMGEVANRLQDIPTDKTVIVSCRSGNRSGQITQFLQQQGYTNVHNMQGGILAWEQAGYPVEK